MGSTANRPFDLSQLFDIAALLDEHKAESTVILDVVGECSFADYFVITTARSTRHAASLIAYLKDFFAARSIPVLNKVQSADQSGWLLIDCGNIIIHVMDQAARSFYELEKLWFRAKIMAHSSKSS